MEEWPPRDGIDMNNSTSGIQIYIYICNINIYICIYIMNIISIYLNRYLWVDRYINAYVYHHEKGTWPTWPKKTTKPIEKHDLGWSEGIILPAKKSRSKSVDRNSKRMGFNQTHFQYISIIEIEEMSILSYEIGSGRPSNLFHIHNLQNGRLAWRT